MSGLRRSMKRRINGPHCEIPTCGIPAQPLTAFWKYSCHDLNPSWICSKCAVSSLANITASPLYCGVCCAGVPGIIPGGFGQAVPLLPQLRQGIADLKLDPTDLPVVLAAVDSTSTTSAWLSKVTRAEFVNATADVIATFSDEMWKHAPAPDDIADVLDFKQYAEEHPNDPAVTALRALATGDGACDDDEATTVFFHRIVEMLRKLRDPKYAGPLVRETNTRLDYYSAPNEIWQLLAKELKTAFSKQWYVSDELDSIKDDTGKLKVVRAGVHAANLQSGLWTQVDNLELTSLTLMRDHHKAKAFVGANDDRESSAAAKIKGPGCRHFIIPANHKVDEAQWKRDTPGWEQWGSLEVQRQQKSQPPLGLRSAMYCAGDEIVDHFHVRTLPEMNFGPAPSTPTPQDFDHVYRDHRQRNKLNADAAGGVAHQFIKPSKDDGGKDASYCPSTQSVGDYPLIDIDLNSDAACDGICDAVRNQVIDLMKGIRKVCNNFYMILVPFSNLIVAPTTLKQR